MFLQYLHDKVRMTSANYTSLITGAGRCTEAMHFNVRFQCN